MHCAPSHVIPVRKKEADTWAFLHLFQLRAGTACAVHGARFLVFGFAVPVLHSTTGWCPSVSSGPARGRGRPPCWKAQTPSRPLFRHKKARHKWHVLPLSKKKKVACANLLLALGLINLRLHQRGFGPSTRFNKWARFRPPCQALTLAHYRWWCTDVPWKTKYIHEPKTNEV